MPEYTATVSATSNSSANTDDTFVEILAAAGSALKIKMVEVALGTAASDTVTTAKLLTNSAAGATGTAGTAAKVNSHMRASSATVVVKNGATAMSVGTTTTTHQIARLNGRATYRWVPPSGPIIVTGAAYFAVALQNTGTSVVHAVTVLWED